MILLRSKEKPWSFYLFKHSGPNDLLFRWTAFYAGDKQDEWHLTMASVSKEQALRQYKKSTPLEFLIGTGKDFYNTLLKDLKE